nr:MAG TPA: hypothetical protein [Caudoviricetes sp.]
MLWFFRDRVVSCLCDLQPIAATLGGYFDFCRIHPFHALKLRVSAHFAGYFQITKGTHAAHDFPFPDILIFSHLSHLLILRLFINVRAETDSHAIRSPGIEPGKIHQAREKGRNDTALN